MYKPTILIVDDEPLNVEYLEQELEEIDCNVLTAYDGYEALERVATAVPDLILLDIMMPRMDGFEVLTRLQADARTRHVPVIIVSAQDDMDSVARGIALGAEDYLPKPFEPILLHARLRSSLEKKQLRDQEQLYLKAMARELEIGRQIQAGFLPEKLPQLPSWEIAAHFAAAREVAGDFYDAFVLPQNQQIGLPLGDVSDKGVGAALYMTLFRSLLRAAINPEFFTWNPPEENARAAVDYLQHSVQLTNTYIATMHGDTGMFATLFFGLLDPETGVLHYINAGHEPVIIIGNGEVRAQLPCTGPAVGIIPAEPYPVAETQLDPGDILLLFSDGVPDAQDEDGDFFARDHLLAILHPPPETAVSLLDHIVTHLHSHMNGAKQFDDITLLAVRRKQ